MRNLLLLVALFLVSVVSAQETCESPKEESLIDLNSITKCSIEPSKRSKSKRARQITVKVSASRARKRFLRRKSAKKALAATSSNVSSSGISDLGASSKISEPVLNLKSNLASITDKLSEEEVRKAGRFTTVDRIPAFKACKNAKKDDRMDCFNTEMIKHIQKHFSYPEKALINKMEGDVWVRFIIDKNGNITNIKSLGPKNAEILDEEAKRVVSLLPKFVPATKDGFKVPVKYGFPISFDLGEDE